VGGIALLINEFAGTISRLDQSVAEIEDRMHHVVGVRRVE
jgi:hypothetical protein